MYDDISEIKTFYKALQGRQVAARLRPRVTDFWERSEGCCNIAIGFATPFLRQDDVDSVLMPQRQGVLIWPRNQPVRSTLVIRTSVPVQTDRLLLVHALELLDRQMLDECWRILDGAGRCWIVPSTRHVDAGGGDAIRAWPPLFTAAAAPVAAASRFRASGDNNHAVHAANGDRLDAETIAQHGTRWCTLVAGAGWCAAC